MAENSKRRTRLIFFHIPKTAGTSLRSLLAKQYEQDKVFELRVEGSNRILVEEFTGLEQQEKNAINLLMGHMPFGLHEEFSTGYSRYFTMLRHPVERAISNFYWIKRNPYHRFYSIVTENDMSLEEFIIKDVNQSLNNGYIKFLNNLNVESDVKVEQLENSKTILDKYFLLTGITEYFDESIILLASKMGWKKQATYSSKNVTRKGKERQSDDQAVRSIIAEKNTLDIQLYNWAKDKFEEELECFGRKKMAQRKEILKLANQASSFKSQLFRSIKKIYRN